VREFHIWQRGAGTFQLRTRVRAGFSCYNVVRLPVLPGRFLVHSRSLLQAAPASLLHQLRSAWPMAYDRPPRGSRTGADGDSEGVAPLLMRSFSTRTAQARSCDASSAAVRAIASSGVCTAGKPNAPASALRNDGAAALCFTRRSASVITCPDPRQTPYGRQRCSHIRRQLQACRVKVVLGRKRTHELVDLFVSPGHPGESARIRIQ
jgi:hypothetical protein